MNRARFVLALAWRESRSSLRRSSLLTASIAAGVGALVAINSFSQNLRQSVRDQARSLLGADLALGSAYPYSVRTEAALGELLQGTPGARLSRVTRFAAMAYVPNGRGTRLAQVTAIDGGYPFYGVMETQPAGEWSRLADDRQVLVDPSLLTALDARIGDILALGEARFTIRGTVKNVPGDVGARAALGPRVFIAARHLDATRLLGFGSRARYEAFVELPAAADPEKLAERYRSRLAAERVVLRTVSDDRENLNESLARLGRFLGLVALIALLLGGVGVASAVHVFIKRKIETIAVLRCLGAGARTLLAVYLLQAIVLGLLGSLVGAALGSSLQLLLPSLLADFLPVGVPGMLAWPALVTGLAMGLGVTVLFSLPPLLAVRRVSPLVVLRRDYEQTTPRRDPARLLATGALASCVVGMASWQAASLRTGLAFSAGIGVALLVLWLAARALTHAVRRFFPSRWSYVWRQGIANLHRPANQTATVILALGFGAFLLDTLLVVQHNLLRELSPGVDLDRPNMVFFDIQPDQRAAIEEQLRRAGVPHRQPVPVVPMRIQSLKGVPAQDLLARSGPQKASPGLPTPWTVRREYRSTYRDHLTATERQVAGESWQPGAWRSWRPGTAGAAVPISMEVDVARELGVSVGDEVVWDVQGLPVPTRVASLREVHWARLEPNFFVVFPEGPLQEAPQSFATLSRVEDPDVRARVQRQIVEAFPNVTSLDLSQVQQAVEQVVGRAALAVRFMALFSLAAGALVLVGAMATSRYQRVREAVLLKTLGATRGQVLRIALAEYLSLGSLGAVAALGLSLVSGWALVRFVFDSSFVLPALPLLALALGLVVLTVAVGIGGSLEVLRKPPLEALRAE